MSPWIPFVDLWGLRGLWWPFEEFEDILRISWEPEVWGPWVPFVHFLDLLRTLWTFWGLFEDLRTWCSQNVEELFRTFCWLLVDLLRTVFRKFWGLCEDHLMTIWGTFDDHRILRTLITFWGIEVALIPFVDLWGLRGLWWPFEEFEDILRISWEPEVWGPWVPFVHFLDFLRTLWTFWGLFEDLRTWCSQNIEEPSWNFWWLLVDLLRTWGLWGIKGLFRTLRIFANLTTYWGIEDVDKFLRTLLTIWVSFEDLRPEDVGDLFVHFPDLLRTLWTFWGLFEDLRTWVSQNVEELFRTFCWLLVDLLRTVFRNFWGLFEDHLMNIWGTFADHRILKTLITFWGLWCRLEYLLWTYEDFEGFDDLLRNLRTFWGSVENLRCEDLGYLLCIFLTYWGLCGPFEDFLKTWGPDALRTLKNFSGPFDDFLWTFWGLFLGNFEDFVRTIWWPFEELLTTTGFWGRW